MEREVEKSGDLGGLVFDDSGYLLFYPTLLGVKVGMLFLSSDRRPNLAKESELPQESYLIYPARELTVFVIFHLFFFAWFPCIYFTF